MTAYETVQFVNEFGQVIEPGAKVIVVAKGFSGNISTYQGRYLGLRRAKRWGKDIERVVCEVESTQYGWFDGDTRLSWAAAKHIGGIEYSSRKVKRVTTLWLNLIYPTT
jgi:hypothetical protein